MSVWFVIQILVNVLFLFGLIFCLVKIQKDREEDVRTHQGLRLLQSKIAVLEDLSDHTEAQSKQVLSLMDKKINEVRSVLKHMDQNIVQVDQAVQKGQKVAAQMTRSLRPPENLDQVKSSRYVQAAQMAHQGLSVQQIVQHLGLPKSEVELIAKVNRKKFMFAGAPGAATPLPAVTDEAVDSYQSVRLGS